MTMRSANSRWAVRSLAERVKSARDRCLPFGADVEARHLGLRPPDTVLVSYPKSGNTWMRFILAPLCAGREVDFESVQRVVPSLGQHRCGTREDRGWRLVKSHEPFRSTYGRRCGRAVD